MNRQLICICGSAGSIKTIKFLLSNLSETFSIPIVLLVHILESERSKLKHVFSKESKLPIMSPEDYTPIEEHKVYVAPPMYHLQIEKDYTFSFSMDEPINFSRPSIDVLLETAAYVYQNNLHVIILSGASNDGSKGVKSVETYGGRVLVLDPAESEVNIMPLASIKALKNPNICSEREILKYILNLGGSTNV
jgi:two-component system chemotaxis response regulator CheB